jgi:hypothetical protein
MCLFCEDVCEVCQHYYRCSYCGTRQDHSCEIIGGKRYCTSCADTLFQKCKCGKLVFTDRYQEEFQCSDCAPCACGSDAATAYINGDNVCWHCLEEYSTCDDCGAWALCDDLQYTNDSSVCDYCYRNNYFTCDNCGEIFPNSDMVDDCLCGGCSHHRGPILSDTFNRIRTTRFYGVEIECCNSYSHEADSIWSIEPEHCGLEYVSPLLQGDAGLDCIKKLYNDIKPKVNDYCGLHVHIDVRDLTDNQRLMLIKAFKSSKKLFYDKVDSSRHTNTYCRRDIPDVCSDDTYTTYMRRVTNDRYCWVNLCSIRKHGSIEIRLHHATDNPQVVIDWVIFLMQFVTDTLEGPCYIDKEFILNRVNELVS